MGHTWRSPKCRINWNSFQGFDEKNTCYSLARISVSGQVNLTFLLMCSEWIQMQIAVLLVENMCYFFNSEVNCVIVLRMSRLEFSLIPVKADRNLRKNQPTSNRTLSFCPCNLFNTKQTEITQISVGLISTKGIILLSWTHQDGTSHEGRWKVAVGLKNGWCCFDPSPIFHKENFTVSMSFSPTVYDLRKSVIHPQPYHLVFHPSRTFVRRLHQWTAMPPAHTDVPPTHTDVPPTHTDMPHHWSANPPWHGVTTPRMPPHWCATHPHWHTTSLMCHPPDMPPPQHALAASTAGYKWLGLCGQ